MQQQELIPHLFRTEYRKIIAVLCNSFGFEQIADAFLSGKETIGKRLQRAKEKLRRQQVTIEFPDHQAIDNRLETVLATLYLLFTEGYYSERNNSVLREDICAEAMRLAYLLTENEQTNQPRVNALLALMCFHASRFAARKNSNGAIILYNDQDEKLWNRELITKGAQLLQKASTGSSLSRYHLEASIAYWHTKKPTRWKNGKIFCNCITTCCNWYIRP